LTVIISDHALRNIVAIRRKKRVRKPQPGDKVVLKPLPAGFTDDLPEDEQRAISARIGRPIMLMGYDRDGRAELEFKAQDDSIHTLFVDLKFIRPCEAPSVCPLRQFIATHQQNVIQSTLDELISRLRP
jgi:hypothetical protein